MRLSMWILADWLEEYTPQLKIQEGNRTLRNARLYSEGLKMERSTVYIGYAGDFISSARQQVICSNGHDLMFLDANDLDEVLNKVFDAFDFYNSWSDMLNEKIKTDCSLTDVLNDSVSVINRIITVADPSYYVYAQAGMTKYLSESIDQISIRNEHIMTLDSILEANKDKRIRLNYARTYHMEMTQHGNPIAISVRNLFYRNQHRGWLITTDDNQNKVTRGDADVQDELGDVIERWIDYHQNQSELVEKSGVFIQILDGTCMKSEEGYRRIESLGWRRADEFQVYVFQRDSNNTSMDYVLNHKLEQLGSGYTLRFEDRLLFILNNSLTLLPQFKIELENLLDKVDLCCGRSPEFFDIFELKPNFEMAAIASDFSGSQDRIKETESAVLPYYYSLIMKHNKSMITHPALKILRQYDLENATQFYLTLKVYLQNERSYIKTAEALHLHRNSLMYRTRRIEELTGLNLDLFETRQYLLLSYEIENIRDIRSLVRDECL